MKSESTRGSFFAPAPLLNPLSDPRLPAALPLAAGTVRGASPPDDRPHHGAPAAPAFLPLPAVGLQPLLKTPRLPLRIDEIRQSAAQQPHPFGQTGAYLAGQATDLLLHQRPGGAQRRQRRPPEDLVGVYVAYAGQVPLVEQEGLEGGRPSPQAADRDRPRPTRPSRRRAPVGSTGEPGRRRSGAPGRTCACRGTQGAPSGRQSAGIVCHQPEREPRVRALLRRIDEQLAGHAKVKRKKQTAVENDDEELAQPVDALDAAARQKAPYLVGAAVAQHERFHPLYRQEGKAGQAGRQLAPDGLYLGQAPAPTCSPGR